MKLFFREGDKGPKVEAIQRKLQTDSRLGRIDGIFGKDTKEAVMAFQLVNKLNADGVVGPKTWKALGLDEQEVSKLPIAPNGKEQILEMFGDPLEPGFWEAYSGFCEVPEELAHCFTYKNKQGKRGFYCHKLMVPIFQACYQAIVKAGLAQELKDFGGCFNIRKIRGGQELSTHSWAIAVDHNTLENPLGAEPKISLKVVAVFESFGFVWGGTFKRKDGMHFQYCKGY